MKVDFPLDSIGPQPIRLNKFPMVVLKSFFSNQTTWPAVVSRWINKYLFKLGLAAAYSRYQETLYLFSSFADNSLYSCYIDSPVFINLGSGCFSHPFWTCYDYPGQTRYYRSIQGKEGRDYFAIDLCSDNTRLPHNDNSVDLIYCSHTLEHLELKSGLKLIEECFRAMKPGGVLRICLPNTAIDVLRLKNICQNKMLDGEKLNQLITTVVYNTFTPAMDLPPDSLLALLEQSKWNIDDFIKYLGLHFGISSCFDPANAGNHISYWDVSRLTAIASDIGYRYAIPQYQGISVAPPFKNPAVFDTTEPQLSFYFELVK